MSLVINARFLTQGLSGVQRYADEILRALDDLMGCDRDLAARLGPVTALVPDRPHRVPGWRHIALCRLPGGSGHLWEQGALARAARGHALLSLGNSGPLLHDRQIVAFHDTHLWDIPDAYDWRYRVWHKALRGRLARRARQVATVSAHSAQALAHRLSLPGDRFRIVPNAADHMLRVPAPSSVCGRYDVAPGGYLLALGNASANKNIARLIDAHATLPDAPPLLVAGGQAAGLRDSGTAARGTCRHLGRVPDADLPGLMRHARGFVFPSLHEGFGIPPLEAMALGVPVAASRTSALPEVLAEAPIWFDPRDTGDIARGLSELVQLPDDARADMVARGRQRAAAFSWQRSACALADLVLETETETEVGTGAEIRSA
ncbi:glycosyltransferase family 4 protein [Roseivivax sp. CAU 1753]